MRQYVVQGVPIPFALEAASTAGPGTPFKIVPLGHSQQSPHLNATNVATAAARDAAAAAAVGGNARKQRPGSAAVDRPKQPKASRNTLRKMLDKLGLDGDNSALPPFTTSAYAESQKRFLDQVRFNPAAAGTPPAVNVYPVAAATQGGPFPGFSPKTYPQGAFNANGGQRGPSILSSELTSILQLVSSSDGSRRSGKMKRTEDGLVVTSNQTSGSLAPIRSIKSLDDEAMSVEIQVGGRKNSNGSKSGSLRGARKELESTYAGSEGMSAPTSAPAWGALDGDIEDEKSGSKEASSSVGADSFDAVF